MNFSAYRATLQIALICALLGFPELARPEGLLHRETRALMGTFCEIQAYHSDSVLARKAVTEALDEMERVDRFLSNYNPDSELSAMNREASRSPFHVSIELFNFLEECRILHKRTLGAFDPTVGPLVRVWGFLTSHPAKPSETEIELAKSRVGFDKVLLDNVEGTVFFSSPGMEVDPGGIGKGYAVDLAVQALKRRGIDAALVSAGGSTIYALGHPPDRSYWRIGIRNLANPQQAYAIVCLSDSSVSTSGVSERSVRIGSHTYSHIFDPRTGEPVDGICQVSVVASSAMDSEAFSKAAFILPRDTVISILKQRANAHCLRVEGSCNGQGTVWETPWSSNVIIPGDH